MSSDLSSNIRQRALGAIFRRAVLSWQSLFTVAFTATLYILAPETAIPGWQPWFWLVGGALAEVSWIAATLADPEANREAVAREFERKFDLHRIKNRVSRERVERGLEYRRDMLKLVKQHKGAMRMHLNQTVDDIDDWIDHMYDMALHIDAFEANDLVERDRRTVPQQIEQTKKRIRVETNESVKQDLYRQLERLEQQQANLEAAVNSVKRAEIQMESTLSSLGTIYAQMSRLGAQEVDSSRAQRLRLEIQDEVASLQDTIDAMDEVQAQQLRLR